MRSMTMTENEAAKYVGLSVKTLQARRSQKKAPSYIKIGRSVRYMESDLDRFIESCRKEFNTEADNA